VPDAHLVESIRRLPKAELPRPPVGSASTRIVAQIAKRYPDPKVPKDVGGLVDYFQFEDFATFVGGYSRSST